MSEVAPQQPEWVEQLAAELAKDPEVRRRRSIVRLLGTLTPGLRASHPPEGPRHDG